MKRVVVGVTAVGLAGAGLLAAEVGYVWQRTYLPAESAPAVRGQFGRAFAPPLRLAVLGDSTAAGVGTSVVGETVAGRLAAALAATGRYVTLDGLGVSGSRTADLAPQVSRALLHRPDLAVVLIGANDATHLASLDRLVDDLRDAVRRLRGSGVPVVVGTCPDLGAVPAFPQPLRAIAGWQGRRVAAFEERAVRDAGGVPVDIGAETGPEFRRHPDRYFASDEFHPGADGYALWSRALEPALLAAASTVAAQ